MIEWCGYKWESVMDGGRRIHPGQPWMWYCDDCARVDSDGVLHLKIEKKPTDIYHWDGKVYHPTIATGIVRTRKSFSYGTFSAEIKLPNGWNLWPSFWTTGDQHWPPEIDIMEAWSGENDYFKWTISQFPWFQPSWRTTTNVHYNDREGNQLVKTSIGSRNIPWRKQKKDPTKNFIEYKVEWFPEAIRFYAGGNLVREVVGEVPSKLVQNLEDGNFRMDAILNLWCEDPSQGKVQMQTEMLAKNFNYSPYSK